MRSDNINRVITKVNTKFCSPMGRADHDSRETLAIMSDGTHIKKDTEPYYDKRIPMSSCGAYDRGGAYWGIGAEMRVMFNRDLSFIHFYRNEK